MKISIYINKNQLYNFLELKEPVELVNEPYNNDFVHMDVDYKDLIIMSYRTHTTVELDTFRKKMKRFWKRQKKNQNR